MIAALINCKLYTNIDLRLKKIKARIIRCSDIYSDTDDRFAISNC